MRLEDTSIHTGDRETATYCSMTLGVILNSAMLKSLSEVPTLFAEIIHRLREYFKGVLFADDFEHDVVHPDCFLDCFPQAVPVDHPSADGVVAPRFRTCVGDMHECNRSMV